jgi:hypothetical protein
MIFLAAALNALRHRQGNCRLQTRATNSLHVNAIQPRAARALDYQFEFQLEPGSTTIAAYPVHQLRRGRAELFLLNQDSIGVARTHRRVGSDIQETCGARIGFFHD